jgi:uncharacterized iron-regulated protein
MSNVETASLPGYTRNLQKRVDAYEQGKIFVKAHLRENWRWPEMSAKKRNKYFVFYALKLSGGSITLASNLTKYPRKTFTQILKNRK